MKRYCLLLICLLISLQSYVYGSDKISKIVLNNGDVITGVIVTQSSEILTIKTEYTTITLNSGDIKSIIYDSKNLDNKQRQQIFPEQKDDSYKTITVKKYNKLPLLSITAASGILAYIQFDKSNERSKEADAYKILGLTDLERKAMEKSEDHQVFGILSTLVAITSLVFSVTPDYEDVPVKKYSFKIQPDLINNGVSICCVKHF